MRRWDGRTSRRWPTFSGTRGELIVEYAYFYYTSKCGGGYIKIFFRLSFIYLYANVVIRAPCFFTLFKRL